MTWKPEDIVVSGAEVAEFKRLIEEGHGTGFALATFLAARMPEKKPNSGISLHVGYNAALDAVAKGKST